MSSPLPHFYKRVNQENPYIRIYGFAAHMNEETKNSEVIRALVVFYRQKINPAARLNREAERNISERLGEFTPAELQQAITNFSKNEWYMKHHSKRGVEWFFNSEERVAVFTAMKPRQAIQAIVVRPDDTVEKGGLPP